MRISDWSSDVCSSDLVEGMRKRIARVRRETHEQLAAKLPGYDSRYFVAQQGMFSYNGLSADQLRALREQDGVYILDSGSLSVPGINYIHTDYFTDAVARVLKEVY